ncbi:hypothetical protein JCM9279_002862 [Rhodotorula babjevae]
MSPPNSTGNSKKASKKGNAKPTSTAPASKSAGKRSASAALADDESALSKRAKRNTSGKKSLREEELGVGGELAEEDMLEAGDDQGAADDDDDDEGDEGDGGVTRCVCGEDNEEMASGLMIQCDTCKCWQHGPCVALWDEKECPNRYFCELCKPNLHGPGGLLRKVNRKSSAPVRGRSPSTSLPPAPKHASSSSSVAQPTSSQHPKPRESLDAPVAAAQTVVTHEPAALPVEREREPAVAGTSGKPSLPGAPGGPEPKKRSTMNSRDAAYDDAIALSILEAGSAAMRARLERGGGKGSGDEGDESEDEVIEEVIVGPGRGRKKSAPVADRASKSGSKKGAVGSKKGGKGKSAPSRGRRSHSHAEDDSPAPHDSADVEPKLEGIEDADETASAAAADNVDDAAAVARAVEEAEGEMGPPGKRRRLSPGVEDEDKKGAAAGEGRTVEHEEAASQEDAAVEAEARSPSPHPSPVHHHGGARAKHPNQYTYRPKNGQPAPTRAPKSPVKRAHAVAAATASGPAPDFHSRSAAASASSLPTMATFGWGMPEHLKHLAHLLPSQSPQPLVVTSAVDPSVPPVAEPSTKVRFPGKRVTMPEMRKRARTVLDFVQKVQVEMVERQRRWELLRDVNERVRDARERGRERGGRHRRAGANEGESSGSGSGSGSGAPSGPASVDSRDSSVVAHPRGVGGTTPVPGASTSSSRGGPDLALGGLPPLPGAVQETPGLELSSAPSAESALLMDALAKEVVGFQQRFFGILE